MELPEISPTGLTSPVRGKVTDDEARTVLAGLKPGFYRSSDLYRRYEALMANQGKEPSSRIALGAAVGRILSGAWGERMRERRTHYGSWEITAEMAEKLSPHSDKV